MNTIIKRDPESLSKEKFPNGITSYLETHCIISIAIGADIEKEKGLAWERYSKQGTGGILELTENLTDEFEIQNINEEWIERDYFDEIDSFLLLKTTENID